MGGGFCPVRGAKRIIDIHIAERRHFFSELVAVFLLADIDAAVLQHHDLTRRHRYAIHPILFQRNGLTQQFGQTLGHGCQCVLSFELPLSRAAEMRSHHDSGARFECGLYRRDGCTYPSVLGDMPCIILRHVHIGTNKNAFSLEFVMFDEITKSVESHVGFLW